MKKVSVFLSLFFCSFVLICLLFTSIVFAQENNFRAFMNQDSEFSMARYPAQLVEIQGNTVILDGVNWGYSSFNNELAGDYYRTRIDITRIKDIYYLSESFPPEAIAAHGMLAFIMKDLDGVVSEDGKRDIGFIVSVEAYLKKGEKYSLLQGMKKDGFNIIYHFYTFTSRMEKSVSIERNKVDAWPLLLTQEQKENLVKNAISEGTKDRSNEMYHTLKNSCVFCAAKMVNTVLPAKQQMKLWTIKNVVPNLRVSYPKWTYAYMNSKKVLNIKDVTKYSWDMGDVTFPTENHEKFTINFQELPGFALARKVITDDFHNSLEEYLSVRDDLQYLISLENSNELSSANSDEISDYREQVAMMGELAEENLQKTLAIFDDNLVDSLQKYGNIQAPPQLTKPLDLQLLDRVHFMMHNQKRNILHNSLNTEKDQPDILSGIADFLERRLYSQKP